MKALKTNESVLLGINEMPIWWAKFSIPIGFWVLALQCLLDFLAGMQRMTTRTPSREVKGEKMQL
jgi:TRAP-type C4-dicarboxylate transport system permease small subunit